MVIHLSIHPSYLPSFLQNAVKAYELRGLSKSQLADKLNELKQELLSLRVQKVAGAAANKLAKIRLVRKSIARVLTVVSQNQRDNLKLFYADKKYVPLDLRPKATRALRRQLTKEEKNKRTVRQSKRERNFPLRKYAIKA